MLRCFAIALLIVAILPGSAAAADWYVAKGGSNGNPCSQAQPCLTIQAAALKPAVADGDTIHIGPGEFASQLLIAKRLTLEGSGSGTTTSFDPASDTFVNAAAAAAPGILLTGGGTLRRLRVQGGQGGTEATPPYPALDLRPTAGGGSFAYEVDGVVGLGGAKGTSGRPGLHVSDNGTGAAKTVSASVSGDSYFSVPIGLTPAVLAEGLNTELVVRSATVAGPAGGTGVSAELGAFVTLTQSNVIDSLGHATGARALGGGSALSIAASTIVARQTGIYASAYAGAGPASVAVSDSLVNVRKQDAAGAGYAAWIATGGAANEVRLDVRNSTLFTSGPAVLGGVRAFAGGTSSAQAALANSVVEAIDTGPAAGAADLVANQTTQGVAKVTASHSSFSDVRTTGSGAATTPDTGTNVGGSPRFSGSEAGNFVPQPGSPLIDRAEIGVFVPGALDLSGSPRSLDGDGDCAPAPDIGAFEAPAAAGTCEPKLVIAARPVRLTPKGVARIKLTCPPGAPSPCSGSFALSSRRKLKLRPKGHRRSRIHFVRNLGLSLAPGQSRLRSFKVARAHRKVVRRFRRIAAVATATLEDPGNGQGVSERSIKLLAPPRTLIARGGQLRFAGGRARVQVSCPAWEIEACAGAVVLRAGDRRLGRARVRVAAGSTRSKNVLLLPVARALVRRVGRLRIVVVVVSRDRAGNRAKTIKRARLRAEKR